MRTRNNSQSKTYPLLSMIVCAALFQATAAAQNKPSSQTTTTFDGAGKESTNAPASAPSTNVESVDVEMLKSQLALHQKRIEQLERQLDAQKKLMGLLLRSSLASNVATA